MDLFKLGQCVSEIFDFELTSVNHMTTSPCSRWPKMHTHHSSNTNMLPEGCLRLCLCAKVHNRHKFNLLHWPMKALDFYRITNQMSSFWHAAPVWSTKLLDIITCYCNIANITHCRIRRFIQQSELRTGFSGMERRDQMTYLTLSARVALYLYQGPSCDVWKTKGSAKMTCNRGE